MHLFAQSLIVVTVASAVTAQSETKREDVVAKAIRCQGEVNTVVAGARGVVLRRLLTPKVGTFEVFAKRNLIVVKDTKVVVDSFVTLVRSFDQAPAETVTTRAFPVRYFGARLSNDKDHLAAGLKRMLTPVLGRVAYDPVEKVLLVTDTKSVHDEIAKVLRQIDKKPKQVFLDVQFIESQDGSVWKEAIAKYENGKYASVGVLTPASAKQIRRFASESAASQIVQAPKLVGLDQQEASIFIGTKKGDRKIGYEISVSPNVVPGTEKLILDLTSGKKQRQILLRNGQTAVLREKNLVTLVTPRLIRDAKTKKVDPAVRRRK